MGSKVIVTGGLGFMGSDFVRFLSSHHPEFEVLVVDNYSYSADTARLKKLSKQIEVINADIRDSSSMLKVTEGAEYVFNFAAETHNDNSLIRPLDFISTNVDGVVSLLQAARLNGFRFHQVSTDEVFGDMEVGSHLRFNEDSTIRPSSPYSSSKAAGDSLCQGWARSFGVKVTISNSANNFGSFQHPEKLIPRSLNLIRQGQLPKIYGDGSNVRDWLHVRDHSRAIWKIATEATSGQRYVVSAHDLVSNLSLIQKMNQVLGKPIDNFEFVSDRPGHDRQYASDSSKLRKELGWRPQEPSLLEWIETLSD